jgi:probable HAF family extracellular repeat protein
MLIRTLLIGLLLASGSAFAAAPLYKIENLGPAVGHSGTASNYYPYDINSNGDVVGYIYTYLSPGAAFIYTPEGGTEVLYPSIIQEAFAINDSRQIAGRSGGNAYSNGKLVDYTTGDWVSLGTLGGPRSTGYGINNSGTVVGSAELNVVSNGYYITHPVRYQNGSLTSLGILEGGNQAKAEAINKGGTVVGSSRINDLYNSPWHAIKIKKNGAMSDLGTLGGLSSYAYDINDSGQVVGAADTAVAGQRRAFIYQNGSMQDLGALNGNNSSAAGINAAGVVVGDTQDSESNTTPFVWIDGVMYDLSSRIVNLSEWGEMEGIAGINDNGVIVGRGQYYGEATSGLSRAFKLTPVNEVEVDVLPGDSANVVYPTRVGKLPVAVLSTPGFDATQVDPESLRFGLGEAAPTNNPTVIADVDGQHGNDTQVRFRVDKSGIFCDDTEVSLYGETYAGELIAGTDQIDASNCEEGSCHVY